MSSASSSSSGVEQKVESLSELKLKGLVVGPIHVAPADEAINLRFEEVSSENGNLEQFKGLVQAAHKKGEKHKRKYIRENLKSFRVLSCS